MGHAVIRKQSTAGWCDAALPREACVLFYSNTMKNMPYFYPFIGTFDVKLL